MVQVVEFDRLPRDRGVAAVVGDEFVALYRIDDEVLAIDHLDPRSGAPVMARGLVASVQERVVVVSPLHKERFDLRTGQCLDDPTQSVRVWPVDIVSGMVHIAPGRPTGR